VNQIKLYFDEDAMHSRLVTALRSRGVTVITVMEAGLTEKTDEEQLAFANERECVLYTFNVSDYFRLHTQWISGGREHARHHSGIASSSSRSASRCAASCVFARHEHHEYAEPSRVPRQLGLTRDVVVSAEGTMVSRIV